MRIRQDRFSILAVASSFFERPLSFHFIFCELVASNSINREKSYKMSSPQGQTIGKASKPWTIGRLLGSGACGSVHELLDPPNSKTGSMQYAIKCVNLPPSSGKASTNKKRKKTAVERNADLLLHEYTILQNSGVNRGTKFPEIPLMGIGGPPGYGETADKSEFLSLNPCAAYGICEYIIPSVLFCSV